MCFLLPIFKEICAIFLCLFICANFHGFPSLLLVCQLHRKMSGIENMDGAQHCYFNALLQCMSVNQTLYQDLEWHNVNHIGKILLVKAKTKHSVQVFEDTL